MERVCNSCSPIVSVSVLQDIRETRRDQFHGE